MDSPHIWGILKQVDIYKFREEGQMEMRLSTTYIFFPTDSRLRLLNQNVNHIHNRLFFIYIGTQKKPFFIIKK